MLNFAARCQIIQRVEICWRSSSLIKNNRLRQPQWPPDRIGVIRPEGPPIGLWEGSPVLEGSAMDFLVVVLWLSVGLQILAAAMALRLIRLSGGMLGWAVLSTVFLLVAVGRALRLLHVYDTAPGGMLSPLVAESLALLVSVLSVAGIVLIGDLFRRLRRAERENARQLDELREFQRLTVGRELRAGELAEENERLRALVAKMSRKVTARPRVGAVASEGRKALG
jgi:hypothetical protein